MGADCGNISMSYSRWKRFWDVLDLILEDVPGFNCYDMKPCHGDNCDPDEKWGSFDERILSNIKEFLEATKDLKNDDDRFILRGHEVYIDGIDFEYHRRYLEILVKDLEDHKQKGERLTWG